MRELVQQDTKVMIMQVLNDLTQKLNEIKSDNQSLLNLKFAFVVVWIFVCICPFNKVASRH